MENCKKKCVFALCFLSVEQMQFNNFSSKNYVFCGLRFLTSSADFNYYPWLDWLQNICVSLFKKTHEIIDLFIYLIYK